MKGLFFFIAICLKVLLAHSQFIHIDDLGGFNRNETARIKKNGIGQCTRYENNYSFESSVYVNYYRTQIYSPAGYLLEEFDSSQEFTRQQSGTFTSKPKENTGTKKKYSYDTRGNLVDISYAKKGSEYTLIAKINYSYSTGEDKIVSAEGFAYEGNNSLKTEFKYDTKGRCIEAKIKFPPQPKNTGELINDFSITVESTYDDWGYITGKFEHEFYSGKDHSKSKIKYIRDTYHNIIEEISYKENGDIKSKKKMQLTYNNNGEIIESNIIGLNSENEKIVYQYDISGNLIRQTRYNSYHPKGDTYEYMYSNTP